MLFVAVCHLVVIGGRHSHHDSGHEEITGTHLCFSCQVSPNVDVDPEPGIVPSPCEVERVVPEDRAAPLLARSFSPSRSRAPPRG